MQTSQPTIAAIQAAAAQVSKPASILNQLHIIARCLAFRQLLARALATQAEILLPDAALSLAAAAHAESAAGCESAIHVCTHAGLPLPHADAADLLGSKVRS